MKRTDTDRLTAPERTLGRERRIRSRALLKEQEPVVFDVLDKALRNGDVAHAYLFAGAASALKADAAILLAQSLFLQADHLIDEAVLHGADVAMAERIAAGSHADLRILDGSGRETISLEQILAVSELFSKTAAEAGSRKVYIILHAENMSPGAMNGLLKFLEEPADHVYAILTTDNIERLLPTVISRCVRVPFHGLDPRVYRGIALAEGADPEDAGFLAGLFSRTSGYVEMAASDTWQAAKALFRQWCGAEGDSRLTYVSYELRKRDSGKDGDLEVLSSFFGLCMQFERDAIRHCEEGPDWYVTAVRKEEKRDPAELVARLKTAGEGRDRVNRNNDLSLVLAQAMFRWEEIEDD